MNENKTARAFFEDVVAGLSATPRSLPCKYLYDARGSELFEAICETEDYYVTRADLALHEAHIGEISILAGPGVHVIELGSGAGVKTRKLLAGLDQPRAYTPVEISAAALAASARDLQAAFPDVEIRPVRADYTQPINSELLTLDPPAQRRLVYFPGSTISNFEHGEAETFLRRMGNIAGGTGAILIGVDLLKSQQRLLAAYDDREGITAEFNLNLLHRIKRELDATVEEDAFAHEARFNGEQKRIEMHLVARRPTRIQVGAHEFDFEAGDSIHTENSHKYSVAHFRNLAEKAGLASVKVWKDPDKLFSMHWLEQARPR
ncbi:MAG: L-histidine N(alpha)-methyltransferase [Wenzhouxiangella sp.]